jgi:hypothetical protein
MKNKNVIGSEARQSRTADNSLIIHYDNSIFIFMTDTLFHS